MPRETLFTHASRRYAAIGSIAAAVLLVAAVVIILAIIDPTPPRTVVMTTGSEGSAYSCGASARNRSVRSST